jgi:hypothetical protein
VRSGIDQQKQRAARRTDYALLIVAASAVSVNSKSNSQLPIGN